MSRSPSPSSRQREDSEISNRLLFRIFQTANLLHTQCSRYTAEFGITAQQWSVLGALSRPHVKAGMTVNQLSDYLLVSRQNLTGILNRLEAQGLTSRVSDATDGRARRVVLTNAGRAIWPKIAQGIAVFHNEALAGFSVDERELFLRQVDKLKGNLTDL